ncbi:MAG TPA: nucleotidyltransferase family protein [Candidatus Sulfotelmatobacter sp.]|nr:nucleotidyltransferase family protein [Candidatus Sulfotelmatobacter sp.]
MKDSTRGNEWLLLLAVSSIDSPEVKSARLRSILAQPLRWNEVFNLADRHGVHPLLFQALSSVADAVPAEPMRFLMQQYQANLHKALFLSRELISILDCLDAAGIEVIPYKGLPLAETLYGDIALRQSGDIDLLIHPWDLARIRQNLSPLGFVSHENFSAAQERAYLKSGYESAFDAPAGKNLLEVQWAILAGFYSVDFDLNAVFRRAVTTTVAGREIKSPALEDLFIILTLHAAKHVWGRLIWLCDLARMMTLPQLDWHQITSQAEELGIARILCVAAFLVNRLLAAPIPDAIANLPRDNEVPALVDEISGYIESETEYDVESPAYFRLVWRLRERTLDRLRFLSRLVWTPGPGDWAIVRLPGALFPLYRVVRLCRLAAKVVPQ